MERILLVEDDPRLGAQVVASLTAAGMAPTWIQRGDEAMHADPAEFDLAILDLMLPGAYGLDVLKRLRQHSDLPVLVLSAQTDPTDKVRSLELGADDFVTKPFWPEELIARIHARLRRPALSRGPEITLGPLRIHIEARRVDGPDGPIDLTKAEFDLLAHLLRRQGAAVTRRELVDACLDPDRDGTERTLDVHVSRLRKKLGEQGKWIATVWRVGYRLQLPEERQLPPPRNGPAEGAP